MVKKKKKIRVRFHLAKGANHKKWQVRHPDGVSYYDPAAVTLRMEGCVLRNQRGTANRIFGGESKRTCAWVECELIEVIPHGALHSGFVQMPISWSIYDYDPKVAPYWRHIGEDCDNTRLSHMVSQGRVLWGFQG